MSQSNEITYPVEKLLKSKAFAEYQPDFLRALLSEKKEYTMKEAQSICKKFFGGK